MDWPQDALQVEPKLLPEGSCGWHLQPHYTCLAELSIHLEHKTDQPLLDVFQLQKQGAIRPEKPLRASSKPARQAFSCYSAPCKYQASR